MLQNIQGLRNLHTWHLQSTMLLSVSTPIWYELSQNNWITVGENFAFFVCAMRKGGFRNWWNVSHVFFCLDSPWFACESQQMCFEGTRIFSNRSSSTGQRARDVNAILGITIWRMLLFSDVAGVVNISQLSGAMGSKHAKSCALADFHPAQSP